MQKQGTQNSQNGLEKNEKKLDFFTIPHFKTYYEATLSKSVWCWHKEDIQTSERELGAQK